MFIFWKSFIVSVGQHFISNAASPLFLWNKIKSVSSPYKHSPVRFFILYNFFLFLWENSCLSSSPIESFFEAQFCSMTFWVITIPLCICFNSIRHPDQMKILFKLTQWSLWQSLIGSMRGGVSSSEIVLLNKKHSFSSAWCIYPGSHSGVLRWPLGKKNPRQVMDLCTVSPSLKMQSLWVCFSFLAERWKSFFLIAEIHYTIGKGVENSVLSHNKHSPKGTMVHSTHWSTPPQESLTGWTQPFSHYYDNLEQLSLKHCQEMDSLFWPVIYLLTPES